MRVRQPQPTDNLQPKGATVSILDLRRGQHFLLDGREYVVVDGLVVADVETGIVVRLDANTYVRKT